MFRCPRRCSVYRENSTCQNVKRTGIWKRRKSSTGRSIRSYGTDHTEATGRNSTSLAELCEKQWADYRDDRYPRFGCVSEYSEKAWVSRAKRAARFRLGLTMCLIACTMQSSPRPTVFWYPFGNDLSVGV
jgi:hypothetical protein